MSWYIVLFLSMKKNSASMSTKRFRSVTEIIRFPRKCWLSLRKLILVIWRIASGKVFRWRSYGKSLAVTTSLLISRPITSRQSSLAFLGHFLPTLLYLALLARCFPFAHILEIIYGIWLDPWIRGKFHQSMVLLILSWQWTENSLSNSNIVHVI